MTALNRRTVITGLAAVAVAVTLPIFAPLRAVFARRRPVPVTAWQVVLSGCWHFEQDEAGRFCIRHVNSGLGFVKEPHADGAPSFTCVAPGQAGDPASLRNCFARAATFVAKEASVLREARQHRGAIYLDYRHSDPWRVFSDIATEDAPPANWVGNLFEWRDFERLFVA
jgi:hypothetical protein